MNPENLKTLLSESDANYNFQLAALQKAIDFPPSIEPIDTTAILTEGASALGRAIAILTVGPQAAELGGLIGKSVLGLVVGLSGKDAEEAFKNEVLSRLDKIQRDLSKILIFLTQELRPLVREETEAALAGQTSLQLFSVITTIRGLVNAYDSQNGAIDNQLLIELNKKGTEALELGGMLIKRGTAWNSAVLFAFTSGVAAFSRLIHHTEDYKFVLSAHAENYKKYAQSCLGDSVPNGYWLDPQPSETLTMAKNRVVSGINEAARRLKDIKNGRVSYIVAYKFIPQTTYRDDSTAVDVDTAPSVRVAWGWWELYGSGLNGDDGYSTIQWPGLTKWPTPDEVCNKLNEIYRGAHRQFIVPNFFDLTAFSPYGQNACDVMVNMLSWALKIERENPSKLEYLEKAIKSLEQMERGASILEFSQN